MLGNESELDWTLTDEALVIRTPREKPCEHAFVFKIVRQDPHGAPSSFSEVAPPGQE